MKKNLDEQKAQTGENITDTVTKMTFFTHIQINKTQVFDFLTASTIKSHLPVKTSGTLNWTQANKLKVKSKHAA